MGWPKINHHVTSLCKCTAVSSHLIKLILHGTYLSRKSLSTTAQMSSRGFPIPKRAFWLQKERHVHPVKTLRKQSSNPDNRRKQLHYNIGLLWFTCRLFSASLPPKKQKNVHNSSIFSWGVKLSEPNMNSARKHGRFSQA